MTMTRTTLTWDVEARELAIRLAGGERKIGLFLSEMVRDLAEGRLMRVRDYDSLRKRVEELGDLQNHTEADLRALKKAVALQLLLDVKAGEENEQAGE